mmetsp:Transcript_17927/g.63268  ORF Transcript_17927/g.63268 Transcript_17927/m.63268 type:complete len:206 (-) Transcript_17927:347-964(-)
MRASAARRCAPERRPRLVAPERPVGSAPAARRWPRAHRAARAAVAPRLARRPLPAAARPVGAPQARDAAAAAARRARACERAPRAARRGLRAPAQAGPRGPAPLPRALPRGASCTALAGRPARHRSAPARQAAHAQTRASSTTPCCRGGSRHPPQPTSAPAPRARPPLRAPAHARCDHQVECARQQHLQPAARRSRSHSQSLARR